MSLDWILEELFLSFEVTTELMQPFQRPFPGCEEVGIVLLSLE